MKLNFGTEEIGRSSMYVQMSNTWLTLKFRITADEDCITLTIHNRDTNDVILADNDEFPEINTLCFHEEKGFNASVAPVLNKILKRDRWEDILDEILEDGEEAAALDGFHLTGLAIDLD